MTSLDFLEIPMKFSSLDAVEYQYFNQLLNHRTIVFNQDVQEDVLERIYLPLTDFEKDDSTDPVTLILNSPGGSVADGLFLCNIIDNYSKPLVIVVTGYACSMATILLCAGNKNPNVTKKCFQFSFGLFHSGQTYVAGESTSVDDLIDFNRNVDNKVKQYIINNTNITEEEYAAHHRKQWYITSSEMKAMGLVDEIIGVDINA